ncbi:MAG: toll/interleukin-1 receptor domain-containing protein [Chthoniobacteraceae bacterium]
MPHDVFISHSSADKDVANAICKALEGAGVRCWIAPRNIEPGADWSVAIMEAMKCPAMVLVFSAHSNDSAHVQREVGRAFAKGLTVIPFRVEKIEPNGSMEYYLASVHWLDAVTAPLDPHLENLAERVKLLLAKAAKHEETDHSKETATIPVHMPETAHSGATVAEKPQDDKVLSVIQEARKEVPEESGLPLRLLLNFSRVIVAGYSSTIGIKIENPSPSPLEDVAVSLESNGFASSTAKEYRRIPPGGSTRDLIEIDSARGGNFVLRCQVKYSQDGIVYYLRGTTQLTVNVVPDGRLSLGDIQIVRGGGEHAAVNISHVVPAGAVHTLNDLLNYTLPDSYAAVPLEMDYDVSQVAIKRIDESATGGRSIPKAFLASMGTGTKLKLDPGESDGAVRGIHLVARHEFKLGRSRPDVDFLTWFWPRTPETEEKTRRLSRVHVIGKIDDEKIFIHDARSTNESTFEGLPLGAEENNEIRQRGTLTLGHEYTLDITPFPSTLPGGLQISNERSWNGPPATQPAIRGCVRFLPTKSEIALFDALWIFTDANFGTSRLNPLVLTAPNVAEAEGRFHYYRENFWIEAFQGSNLRVNGTVLKPNEIVPIATGQEISIGPTIYHATVEP